MTSYKKRLLYLLLFLALTGIELLIALFVHDAFFRPYVGDILVVGVVYCFVRIFIPEGVKLLPLYVFLFALAVEITQYFNLAALLGLDGNQIVRIMLGNAFDWKDILCYALGCAILGFIEIITKKIVDK